MSNLITAEQLRANPNWVFVFGDNTLRKGYKGAAALRDEPNTYGFITKKYPSFSPRAYYTPSDYYPVFKHEMSKLVTEIYHNPSKLFLISELGSGLANRYGIWEKIILPGLETLRWMSNTRLLWNNITN